MVTPVRSLTRMYAEVPGQVTAMRETSRTNVTLEGLLAGMGTYMSFQIPVLCKASLTNITLVRSLASMYHHMYFQVRTLHKALATLITLKRFLREVSSTMRVKVAELTETSVAHVAHILFIRMSFLVAVQVTQPLESHATHSTLIRFYDDNFVSFLAFVVNDTLYSRTSVVHGYLCCRVAYPNPLWFFIKYLR